MARRHLRSGKAMHERKRNLRVAIREKVTSKKQAIAIDSQRLGKRALSSAEESSSKRNLSKKIIRTLEGTLVS